MEAFWLGVVLKMALSAFTVVAASLLVERVGPFIGAMVATLPISGGPAYIFLAVDHGPLFLADSVVAGLAVNAVTPIFVLTYAALAQRRGLAFSLGAGMVVWAAGAWVISHVPLTMAGALIANLVSLPLCLVVARRFTTGIAARAPVPRWWDIPLRAAMVVVLIAFLLLAAHTAGPSVAGIVAVFPIVLTSLVLILHPRIGGPGAAAVLSNAIPGLFGFGLALVAVHALAPVAGSVVALSAGLAVCAGWNLSLVTARRRKLRRAVQESVPAES
jgi:hypothetical protein